MVARDGVEPPTPAFSDLVQPEPTTPYMVAGDCQVPANTCKTSNHGLESWAEQVNQNSSTVRSEVTRPANRPSGVARLPEL
jgi:hypothetical protein